MRILVIGGTRFVGRHLAAAALDRGHQVTLFHRGRSGAELFPEATHLLGDRDTDLSALQTGAWDATIDPSAYVPRQVRGLADRLAGRGGRYISISSTAVYATPTRPLFTEDAPLVELPDPTVEQVTGQTYGGLKVLCERAAAERFGQEVLVVRPTYVVGPFDYTGRFSWWLRRISRGGEVLAPSPAEGPIQLIDARDLASWIVDLVERNVAGTFHAVSPPPPFSFGDLLDEIVAVVGPPRTTLTWAERSFLLAAGQDDTSLPLWPGADPDSNYEAADPGRAAAAGLAPRPLGQTIHETLQHELTQPTPTYPGIGLPAAHERDLLASWHARSASSQA